ncbi:MAG: tetratricopeptide repeat protein, partial [Ignavibacteriales bacterium]|nr:tetratricopeptide repeat protein [Ignavibacteriales bacterium]
MSVKLGLITFLIFFFTGCSVYDNVTSYFNTYYNAKKFFDEAEREIEKTPQKDRDTNYFPAYNISKGIEDKLDKVIEKCSKLIQLYPQSSWVEDAIVMIGKSYVYKGESESAIRKFNELLENFPTSDLLLTSRLWKARAQYNSKREDEAITSVDELVPDAQANGEEDIAIEALMLKGQILIEREDYTAAQASYEKAISFSGSGDLLAIAQFQLGLCHARLSHYLEAAEAYAKVTDYNPTVVKEFQAQIRGGMMLSTAGEYTSALDIFESLQSQALKPDERGLVELEMANTYKRMNDTAIAFEMYDRIDTIYKRTDAAAKSYYERGLSFENDFSDYRNALGFYEKAKAEFPSSEITQIAQRKVQYLTRYFKLRESLTKFDSLLYLKLSPDSSGIGGDSLNIEHDTLDSDQISIAPTVTEGTAIDTLSDVVEKPSELESESYDLLDENLELLPEEHSLQTARASRNETSSSLAIDDTKMSKEERSQPKGKSDQAKGAMPAGSDSLKGAGKSLPPDPLAKASPDSIRKLIGQVKFELGVLFLLEMNLPDSALYFYQDIIQNLPESKLVPRAYYAMAEIYREKND